MKLTTAATFTVRHKSQYLVVTKGNVTLTPFADQATTFNSIEQAREIAYRTGACQVIPSDNSKPYLVGADSPIVAANKKACFYYGAPDNNVLMTLSKAALADILTECIRQLHGECDNAVTLLQLADSCNNILRSRGDKPIETGSDFI